MSTSKLKSAEEIVGMCRAFHLWLADQAGETLTLTTLVRREDTVYVVGNELDLDVLQTVLDEYDSEEHPAASQSVH